MTTKQPIREMQGYLRLISADYPRIPELKPDGIFGPLTTEAVVEFQRQFELTPNGIVDFETWTRIYEVYRLAYQRQNPPHGRTPFPLQNGSYGIGDSGSEIVFIQTLLNELSTAYLVFEPIRVLGMYEEITAQNIRELQARSGLVVTGCVDAETWNALLGIYATFKSGQM